MRLQVLAVGTRMPSWVEQGRTEYCRRLPREFHLEWYEIPLGQRGRGASVERAMATESAAMMARIGSSHLVLALDQEGRSWTTRDLAGELATWQMEGRSVALLIGGPDGLGRDCRERADKSWSLSRLTLPHPLVRVLLAEQLYRAWSINQGHPYHR